VGTTEERFRIVNQGKMSWLVLLDEEVCEEFTDKEDADAYVTWFSGKIQAAYSQGYKDAREASVTRLKAWFADLDEREFGSEEALEVLRSLPIPEAK